MPIAGVAGQLLDMSFPEEGKGVTHFTGAYAGFSIAKYSSALEAWQDLLSET